MRNKVAENINQTKEQKRAVLYLRYSSDKQTENSIEGQRHVCQEFARKNNITIVDEYVDRALSGKNDRRPEFQRMIKDAERNKGYTIILVYSFDRFGRSVIGTSINKQRLLDSGKILFSATETNSYYLDGKRNPSGIITEGVHAVIAEYYSVELAQKVIRGNRERRKSGRYTGGHVVYGYYVDKNDMKYYIIEEKAEMIRQAYMDYASGMTVEDIRRSLAEKGVDFTKTTMSNVLQDKRYIGIAEFCVEGSIEVYDNIIPPILSEDLFYAVQRRREQISKQVGKYTAVEPYLLSGKVYCGECGSVMIGDRGHSHTGEAFSYYKCRGRKKERSGCISDSVWKEYLEDLVFETTMNMLNNSEIIRDISSKVYELFMKKDNAKSVLKALIAERTKVQKGIDNILTAIADGMNNYTLKQKLNELEAEKDRLQVRIANEQGKAESKITKDKILRYIIRALTKDKEFVLQRFVRRVVIYADRTIIYYGVTEYDKDISDENIRAIENGGNDEKTIEKDSNYGDIEGNIRPCYESGSQKEAYIS